MFNKVTKSSLNIVRFIALQTFVVALVKKHWLLKRKIR